MINPLCLYLLWDIINPAWLTDLILGIGDKKRNNDEHANVLEPFKLFGSTCIKQGT